MLKVRIIPTLLYKDFGLVKGVQFDSRRQIGSAMQAVKVYNLRGVDELVFLDVTATLEGRAPDVELIDELADECFMPLTVGGGVRSLDDVRRLLRVGADKVAINTAAAVTPDLVRRAAERFGSQCVVVSIDTRTDDAGTTTVWTHSGTVTARRDPLEWAQEVEALGAGEILLTSIDRDGTMTGYDLETLGRVAGGVSIPVIASGGAGSYDHFAAALDEGAAAVAAASIFHFTEQTPREAKLFLQERRFPVRL
ncbi:MAG: imidazole glycerol phosphate synthase subunit HisF [Actinobacteria bacterium]|nr:MAG: imidazole glycerol phosphate synthase subunit HisF [Actinomycetota bacterium]